MDLFTKSVTLRYKSTDFKTTTLLSYYLLKVYKNVNLNFQFFFSKKQFVISSIDQTFLVIITIIKNVILNTIVGLLVSTFNVSKIIRLNSKSILFFECVLLIYFHKRVCGGQVINNVYAILDNI